MCYDSGRTGILIFVERIEVAVGFVCLLSIFKGDKVQPQQAPDSSNLIPVER